MIQLGEVAEEQIRDLLDHDAELGRPEAQQRLLQTVQQAADQIERGSILTLQAPRPYPHLARPGELWVKAGRYWIAYNSTPLTILAIFYDAADIPKRR